MVLPDVNVLVAAYRDDASEHASCRPWLKAVLGGDEAFAISDLVLSGFLRIVTHPRIFRRPSPPDEALSFANVIRKQPHCIPVSPGPRHWEIFTRLYRDADTRGSLIPDAYFAALAIEAGCEWITFDGDFARFEGLRWSRPRPSAPNPSPHRAG